MLFIHQRCRACGERYARWARRCPRCLTPAGLRHAAPSGMPAQLVCVYQGNHAVRDFQRDAERMASAGWRVQSQEAGGYNAMKIGKRPPTTVTVVYVRG